MEKQKINHYSSHQDVLMLLPWYINKTLSGDDIFLVEKHLQVCLYCRHEVQSLQQLSTFVNQADVFESAAHHSFSKLKKQIDQNPKKALTPAKNSKEYNHRWFPKLELNALFWKRSAIALFSLLFITLLLPLSQVREKIFDNQFQTLSENTHFNDTPSDIRVVFKEDTPLEHIVKTLEAVNGSIVSGPSPQGVYTVHIAGNQQMKSISKLIMTLKKNNTVVFAEPNYHLLSSAQLDDSN